MFTCPTISMLWPPEELVTDTPSPVVLDSVVIRSLLMSDYELHGAFGVLDCYNKKFHLVTDGLAYIWERPVADFREKNFAIYSDHMEESELSHLASVQAHAFKYLARLPQERKYDQILSFSFRIKIDGRYRRVQHSFSPIQFGEDGKIQLLLCIWSFSSRMVNHNAVINDRAAGIRRVFNEERKTWEKIELPTLTVSERSVLSWAIQGLSISDAASENPITSDTIRKYRQYIFEKLEASNINMAISRAFDLGLL